MGRWKERIELADLWHSFEEDESQENFLKVRDEVVRRFREASWMKDASDADSEMDLDRLSDLLDQLAYTETTDEFDSYWDDVLDWADDNRLWVETMIRV